jgi:cytidyltransferase-like protein
MYDNVYTVGFFNNFHYGHWKLLERMREKGNKLIVGVYDDKHMRLIKKLPEEEYEPLEVRMGNVKKYAELVYVISSLDPELYLEMMKDPTPGLKHVFIRADDMKFYPGWEWVKENMKSEMVPYSYKLPDDLGDVPKEYHKISPQEMTDKIFIYNRF